MSFRKALILTAALNMPAAAALEDGVQTLPVTCLAYDDLRDMVQGDHAQALALSGSGSAGSRTGADLRFVVTYSPGHRDYTVYVIDPRTGVACVLSAGKLDHQGS
ncbi:MAG: hypothetical protein RJQ08_08545 [Salinisphaeraceae bacterium]